MDKAFDMVSGLLGRVCDVGVKLIAVGVVLQIDVQNLSRELLHELSNSIDFVCDVLIFGIGRRETFNINIGVKGGFGKGHELFLM